MVGCITLGHSLCYVVWLKCLIIYSYSFFYITSWINTLFKYFISDTILTSFPKISFIDFSPIVRLRWVLTLGHSSMIWLTVSSVLHMLHRAGSSLGMVIRWACVIKVCPIRRRVRFTWVLRSVLFSIGHGFTVSLIFLSLFVSGSAFHLSCHLVN